jgi:hypothetical protein
MRLWDSVSRVFNLEAAFGGSQGVRAEHVRSSTPSASNWQHLGVSSDGQRSEGARCSRGERFSIAAAEVRAAKAAKAKEVNCMLKVLLVGRLVWREIEC